MEYLTDIDEFQAALKKVNVNEDMNVTKSNNVLLEGVELDCYHKCQKILDTPEMKKCHKRCLDVNFDELNESDIDTINELYDLGIERGLIDPDTETDPEDNPEDQMDDQNVQEPLKDVGDGCELDDVDGDAYWDMKKALRECGEYGSIDKSIEEEIMDEEYPTDGQVQEDDYMDRYKALQKKSYDKIEKQFDTVIDFGATQYIEDNNGSDELYDKIIDYLKNNKDEVIDSIYRGAEGIDRLADMIDYLGNELIPEIVDKNGNIIDIYSPQGGANESEDPTMSEDPQSDEMTPHDGYDEDELIAALDDKDVAPSDSDIEKMKKDAPEVKDDDMPFEAEGDDTASDDTSTEDTVSDTEGGDEVQDTSSDSDDTETTDTEPTDNTEGSPEDGAEVEDTSTDTEEGSTEDTSTEDTETSDTEDTETTDDEDSDEEESDDENEKSEKEDKPEEKDLTADDKAQLKNEYTNMFSDIIKGMLSDVEAEDGERAELCVKDMTPDQKSEFWGKVAEQWEGKADPADFMSASELESLEKQVEKKEKEESSKED